MIGMWIGGRFLLRRRRAASPSRDGRGAVHRVLRMLCVHRVIRAATGAAAATWPCASQRLTSGASSTSSMASHARAWNRRWRAERRTPPFYGATANLGPRSGLAPRRRARLQRRHVNAPPRSPPPHLANVRVQMATARSQGQHDHPHYTGCASACSAWPRCSPPAPTPEPLELSQPIAVDTPGQQVQFEFETTARNFAGYRTYAVELDLQHVSPSPDAASPRDLHIPLRVGLQQWSGGTWRRWQADAYQIAQSQSGQPLPDWHRDAGLNYAQTQRGSDGAYRLHVALLPFAGAQPLSSPDQHG